MSLPPVTQPYIHVRGATTSVCRRTSFRKAFLAPWHELVNEIWLYSLGDAQQKTKVSVHMSKLVMTHHHTEVTASEANLPEFTRRLHQDVSCAVNDLLREHRYEAPGDLWDGRPPHYLRLLDATAQMSHLTYSYLNQAAAGLVDRPEHMPGRQLHYGMWNDGEGIVIKRPPIYFGSSRPSEVVLKLEPPPELMRAFGGDRQKLIHHMRKLARDGQREIRAARKWRPLGAERLKNTHPYDEARTPAEPRGQRIPTFRIGAGGSIGRQQRIDAAKETTAFRQQHAEVRKARLGGDDTEFPFGTYGQRVYHGAPVDEPQAEALLAQPGMLLHEVLEELENDPAPADPTAIIEEVRADISHTAADWVTRNEVDYRRPAPDQGDPSDSGASDSGAPDGQRERPKAETIHQGDPRKTWKTNPRRLIVRRDCRRGRPPKKPGADPPVE